MKRPIPGEWQVDEFGQRYRMLGTIKEYEPRISIDGIEIPQSQLAAFHERNKAAGEARRKAENDAAKAGKTDRFCPFKMARNNVKIDCEKTCAFYEESGCSLVCAPPKSDSSGKYCPIAGRCNDRCAMYAHGCSFIEIFKCLKGNE